MCHWQKCRRRCCRTSGWLYLYTNDNCNGVHDEWNESMCSLFIHFGRFMHTMCGNYRLLSAHNCCVLWRLQPGTCLPSNPTLERWSANYCRQISQKYLAKAISGQLGPSANLNLLRTKSRVFICVGSHKHTMAA